MKVAATLLLALLAGPSFGQDRGELLYGTHCNACHTEQMHWRERRAATDWLTLKGFVRHWQGELRLNWSDDDITDVARHLNRLYYKHPETSAKPAG